MTGPPDGGPPLPTKVAAIAQALAEVPHAFGGAIALAYYAEPRATIDIDVNVFLGGDRFASVGPALEAIGVAVAAPDADRAARDGQVRLQWGRTPIDLFFSYDPFHDAAAAGCRRVPFADTTIGVLSATHLAACKAVFDRPKDWVDIAAMLEHDAPIDVAEALRWVGRIAGDTDPRFVRLASVLTRRSPGDPGG